MDPFTSLIIVILSCLVFIIVSLGLSVIVRAKNQTRNALKNIEEQIRHRLIEKIVFAAASQRKNLYKYGQIMIKSIVKLFKKFPFQVEVSKRKTNKKSKNNKSK